MNRRRLRASCLAVMPPLDVVEQKLIPALDAVGEQYEKQIIFLPQLMNAAAASGAAFDEVRRVIERSGAAGEGKGPIVLATVEGDIHDIGKEYRQNRAGKLWLSCH